MVVATAGEAHRTRAAAVRDGGVTAAGRGGRPGGARPATCGVGACQGAAAADPAGSAGAAAGLPASIAGGARRASGADAPPVLVAAGTVFLRASGEEARPCHGAGSTLGHPLHARGSDPAAVAAAAAAGVAAAAARVLATVAGRRPKDSDQHGAPTTAAQGAARPGRPTGRVAATAVH